MPSGIAAACATAADISAIPNPVFSIVEINMAPPAIERARHFDWPLPEFVILMDKTQA
jgi:hypothetical protein